MIASRHGARYALPSAFPHREITPAQGRRTLCMSKSMDSRKNVKKKPLMTLREKRAAKAEKEASRK